MVAAHKMIPLKPTNTLAPRTAGPGALQRVAMPAVPSRPVQSHKLIPTSKGTAQHNNIAPAQSAAQVQHVQQHFAGARGGASGGGHSQPGRGVMIGGRRVSPVVLVGGAVLIWAVFIRKA